VSFLNGDAQLAVTLATERRIRPIQFVPELIEACRDRDISHLVAEENGLGGTSYDLLEEKLNQAAATTRLHALVTSAETKADGYGYAERLFREGRLLLHRGHTELRRQLANLEVTTTDHGTDKIAVPDRLGHDDLADALSFACWFLQNRDVRQAAGRRRMREVTELDVGAVNGVLRKTSDFTGLGWHR
jgi:hypothetical protein